MSTNGREKNAKLKSHYQNNFASVEENKKRRINRHCTRFPNWAKGMGYTQVGANWLKK